ncbi:MAG: 2,3,4,5-tetrahydropyridine-2,6-dicarboxylate N-succinyltransferase [Solirubrobacteraceae bacterium]|nr:2,3,4,5-tetrahydropyridine-2,6-dicarboxylate N-succinyltransferase [Solirubrobacteraceae bacterium]
MSSEVAAWGVALGTFAAGSSEPFELFFPQPSLGAAGLPAGAGPGWSEIDGADTELAGAAELLPCCGQDALRDVRTAPVLVAVADLTAPAADVADAYLRLHLLSHRLVEPQGLNADGLLGLLPNVAWTDIGPVPAESAGAVARRVMADGRRLHVRSVDKVPRMVDYVVPSGVRIADADRVRLGAHLAEGTTVMHEGFVNFNAGTLGPSMVEGRISAGVVVGPGSDLGGGASIMGTLSGGGSEVISVGSDCLIGANAGIGISLGDGCIVEAGLYVTGGTVVALPDGAEAKARELSGASGLLFRRTSLTGAVEVLERAGSWGGLNPELHAN